MMLRSFRSCFPFLLNRADFCKLSRFSVAANNRSCEERELESQKVQKRDLSEKLFLIPLLSFNAICLLMLTQMHLWYKSRLSAFQTVIVF